MNYLFRWTYHCKLSNGLGFGRRNGLKVIVVSINNDQSIRLWILWFQYSPCPYNTALVDSHSKVGACLFAKAFQINLHHLVDFWCNVSAYRQVVKLICLDSVTNKWMAVKKWKCYKVIMSIYFLIMINWPHLHWSTVWHTNGKPKFSYLNVFSTIISSENWLPESYSI